MTRLLTDCPSEYAQWEREQEHANELYDEYVFESVEKAKAELKQTLDLLDRVPRYQGNALDGHHNNEHIIAEQYAKQIRSILDANGENIILQHIIQPLLQALVDVDFNLEASAQLRSERHAHRPEVSGNDKGES